jgi:hypothetical protein
MQNWFLSHIYKIYFLIFWAASRSYDQKNIFFKLFRYGYQKTQNLMPSSNSLKKLQKNLHEESYRAENFCTQYWKVKKYIIPTLLCW